MLLCLLSCANKKVGRPPGRVPATAWNAKQESRRWRDGDMPSKRDPLEFQALRVLRHHFIERCYALGLRLQSMQCISTLM